MHSGAWSESPRSRYTKTRQPLPHGPLTDVVSSPADIFKEAPAAQAFPVNCRGHGSLVRSNVRVGQTGNAESRSDDIQKAGREARRKRLLGSIQGRPSIRDQGFQWSDPGENRPGDVPAPDLPLIFGHPQSETHARGGCERGLRGPTITYCGYMTYTIPFRRPPEARQERDASLETPPSQVSRGTFFPGDGIASGGMASRAHIARRFCFQPRIDSVCGGSVSCRVSELRRG